jgi:hypothetical protein
MSENDPLINSIKVMQSQSYLCNIQPVICYIICDLRSNATDIAMDKL